MWKGIFGASIKLQNTPVLTSELIGINAIIPQTIRWYIKKPMWLPPGKTKLFRVHPRRTMPKEEHDEILRLYNGYRTACKSLYQFLSEEAALNQIQFNEENEKKKAEIDFERCKQINDEWNKQIALTREERLKNEWEKKRVSILNDIEKERVLEAEQKAKAEEYIKKVKQIAATFITKETIDQAIADALETVVDHNEAIDIEGNRYREIFEKERHAIRR